MAKLLEDSLAQLEISSAKHSEMDLMDLKEARRAPWVIKKMELLTLLNGETSTACLLTVPELPTLQESSLGPPFLTYSLG